MSELLKALQGLPERTEKKHFVTIDGKKLQVPLKKKLEIQQHGEENYMLKPAKFGPEIVLRPKPKKKTRFPVLQKAEKGYTFEDNDIHWPNGVVEGGETWLIEYE
jgi:hypothetical protein